MRNNVAYIIEQMSDITGHAPVKKSLQKMIFLIERKGVSMGFDYTLHFYGPYCAELDRETSKLSTDGIIEFDYTGYGHKMNLTSVDEDIESDGLTENQLNMVEEVIQRYSKESASDLELLTTAIYAYEHTGAKTRPNVAENVKKIKGTKYSDKEISWALDEFPYFGINI